MLNVMKDNLIRGTRSLYLAMGCSYVLNSHKECVTFSFIWADIN